jgi:formiminoglutamase
VNGRFRGGYITRSLGDPANGIHAVQMELSCRGYLREPVPEVDPVNWPAPFDADFAEPLQRVLARVLHGCVEFATRP